MIKFPEIELDDESLYFQAEDSFIKCVKNLLEEDKPEFRKFFKGYDLSQLKCALTKIQYTKYMHDQDLVFYDQSTDFHVEVRLHVYAVDEDGDKETLAGYALFLNQNGEMVDDILH